MLMRTWPYGTAKRVKVLSVEFAAVRGKPVRVMACEETDNPREGHVIVGDGGDEAAPGDFGVITFCQGGSSGGFWRYEDTSRKGAKTQS